MTRRSSEIYVLLATMLLLLAGVADAHVIKTKWISPTSTTSSEVVTDGNYLYSVTDSGQLTAFDRTTGGKKWTAEIGSRALFSPVAANGVVYVGTDNGVYAFDSNGQPTGNISLVSPVMTPLVYSEGNVIAITKAGEVDVIAAGGQLSKSKLLRTMTLPGETEASTALYSGKLYVFLTDGRMISADPFTGAVVSLYDSGRPVWRSTPVVVNDIVYVGAGRYFMGISTSGGLNLSKEMNGVIYSPVYSNGSFYVGSDDGNLYSLTMDGEMQWAFGTGDAIRSKPLVTENAIYFGSHDKSLYSITSDGKLRWSTLLTDWPSSPIIIEGTLYTACYDGSLTAVSPMGCSISFPEENATVFGRISIAGEGYADAGIKRVELRTVPGDWQAADGTEQWSTTMQVSGFAEGNLGIECRIVDKQGNTEMIPYEEHYYNYVFSEEKLPSINATYPQSVNVKQPIAIQFTDTNGNPLSGITVTAGSAKYNVTESSGTFVYIPQTEGELKLFAEKPNYRTKTLTIAVTKPLIQPIYVVVILIIAAAVAIYMSIKKGRWR
ncbi:Outer membrane protein assembly factor BamB [uncultured archaeon]|nr:Outer membrane protein assembly factor BamB [uncultured archaeon]